MSKIKKLIDKATSPDISFDRRTLTLVGFFSEIALLVSVIGDFFIGENIVEIIVLMFFVIANPIASLICMKLNKVSICLKMQIFGLAFVALPVSFFYGGGPYGGGIYWAAFIYMFIGIGLTGAFRVFMVISVTVILLTEYIVWYFNPEIVVPHTRLMFTVDTVISLLLVGILISVILLFEKHIFKRENARAREAAELAEELNVAQSMFFSNMSHEIRTPINSILGLNEIILRQQDASDEIKKDAINIQGAGKMLLTLVNDILDISKIEAGKMDIVPVNYSIASLISEIVNMIWLRTEEKGLKFKVDIDPSIPKELYGDEVRIKQVLINLLNNAVKYTKEGSVTLYMECEEIDGDKALINLSVSDTGMGIKQDAIPYLFDSFQRVDQEKNRYIEGTGLGLSIVKQLVDLMGGKITVNSVYSQGSTFAVQLWQSVTNENPIGEVNISNYGTASHEKYQSSFTAPEARILIVDDNEMNLEVEKKLLAETEIEVDTATSGKRALELTVKHHYDLIFMDHLMPEMDGLEAFAKIRKQLGGLNHETPVVVLTANAGSENIRLYNNNGFDGYLVKPVSGRELEEMLLNQLPESKISLNEALDMSHEKMNTTAGYNRKIPIMIATSSMCDLPETVMKEMTVEMIPYLIHNDSGTFYDYIEAECDELVYYMNKGSGRLESEPPTVEDFEEFYANVLKKCHNVIYIALSSSVSREYDRAIQAASAFENITVINSENISSAMGFMVMAASQMAKQGEPVERIVERLESIKRKVHSSFIIDSTEYMIKRGFINELTYKFMKTMHIRPSLRIKNDVFGVERIWFGSTKRCYEKYINHVLQVTAKPDLDVVFITYVDLNEEILEWIKEEVKQKFDFQNIIFQKASAAISLNCGPGTFGILYMDAGKHKYNFSVQLSKGKDQSILEDEEEEIGESIDEELEEKLEAVAKERVEANVEESVEKEEPLAKAPVQEPVHEQVKEPLKESKNTVSSAIKGIDMEVALKNSGSKDAFLTVLKIFYDTMDKKAGDIRGYYEAKDWKNFTILVHGLKSAARLIGAVDLGNDAEKMEAAGKASDLDYINEHYDSLMRDYEAYKDYLRAEFEPEEPKSDKPMADMELMSATYEALKIGAEEMNCSMIEDTFAELEDYSIPDEEIEKFKALKEKFDSFDYEGMTALLDGR